MKKLKFISLIGVVVFASAIFNAFTAPDQKYFDKVLGFELSENDVLEPIDYLFGDLELTSPANRVSQGNTFQKTIQSFNSFSFKYFLSYIPIKKGLDLLLYVEKYLAFIYPSHNFW